MAKGESHVHPTPHLHSVGGSTGLTVWLHFAITYVGWRFDPGISSAPERPETPSNKMCHWTPQVYLPNDIYVNHSNGMSRVHECDRQTDHASEKYVGISKIDCATRAIPPNNNNKSIISTVYGNDKRSFYSSEFVQ